MNDWKKSEERAWETGLMSGMGKQKKKGQEQMAEHVLYVTMADSGPRAGNPWQGMSRSRGAKDFRARDIFGRGDEERSRTCQNAPPAGGSQRSAKTTWPGVGVESRAGWPALAGRRPMRGGSSHSRAKDLPCADRTEKRGLCRGMRRRHLRKDGWPNPPLGGRPRGGEET